MLIQIPKDFLVTTIAGSINFELGKRLILASRTRSGKTLLSAYCLAKAKQQDPESICIHIGPNLGAFVADVETKFELEPYVETGVRCTPYNKATAELFALDLAGLLDYKTIFCVNADHTHVKKIISLIKRTKKRVYLVIDEAHKAGPQTYEPILKELQLPNVAMLETTATFRSRLLTRPHAKVEIISSRAEYTLPTDARLIPFHENSYTVRNKTLHDLQIDEIVRQTTKNQSLTLINGYDKTVVHNMFKRQVREALEDVHAAVIVMNGGQSRWSDTSSNEEHAILHKDTNKPIRDASSVIKSVQSLGYNHIVVIGQKQVEMGQTIGFAGFPMTLQIQGTPISTQNADALAQNVRTGGLNISCEQSIMIDPVRWKDYCDYIEHNEELSFSFRGLSPQEQEEVARKAYFSRPGLRVPHGDYTPVPRTDTTGLPVVTEYFEVDCPDSYKSLFQYQKEKRATGQLIKYVRSLVMRQPWYSQDLKLSARTVIGGPETVKQSSEGEELVGGNDTSAFINANPTGTEPKKYPLLIWLRDDKLCIRLQTKFVSGLTHDYYGKLQNRNKKAMELV
jgi:hypothetical protein